MKTVPALSYSCPIQLESALRTLTEGSARIIAGGTDVYPSMQAGQQHSSYLDVTKISGFQDITSVDGGFRFGAAVTWSDVIAADLPKAFDALKQAARQVGSIQIQNAGTIAGNLCNASPAADGVPPLLALDASVELVSNARGKRVVPLADFITGVRKICLAADELVSAVHIPSVPAAMSSSFEKLGSRQYLVISICMTAVNIVLDQNGCIDQVSVAVGSCSEVAKRLPALEDHAIGKRPDDVVVTPELLSPLKPIDDVRGSAGYRLDAVAVQCSRALKHAAKDGAIA